MHATRGPSVVARHVAALEAAIDDMRKTCGAAKHLRDTRLERRRAARTARCAEVQIRQPAREKARHAGTDRMAIEQYRVAVQSMYALDFRLQAHCDTGRKIARDARQRQPSPAPSLPPRSARWRTSASGRARSHRRPDRAILPSDRDSSRRRSANGLRRRASHPCRGRIRRACRRANRCRAADARTASGSLRAPPARRFPRAARRSRAVNRRARCRKGSSHPPIG